MIEFLSCPKNVLRVSTQLLIAGLAVLLAGIGAGYGLENVLSIPVLVLAHSGLIIGPTMLKIGYVMRLLAQHYMKKEGWEANCAIA
ncbi:transmembrane sensor/regulator PpyR [Pseudomonas sp. PDM16]|uniref:transmembrane sensor/regulator PpyR n=1 Tax=Pseudomonas sp. PDM16 TaxID=2769292 RepID=UPI00177D6C04|nr:transmembrane sensor/regulator PpyR [Pseudomonas sp. PDM16]MBD9416356.1 transmembrane sensor/regulator PpyR [Pseudomonas sp. PDM16]